MNVPAELKYTATHEWIRTDADGTRGVAGDGRHPGIIEVGHAGIIGRCALPL